MTFEKILVLDEFQFDETPLFPQEHKLKVGLKSPTFSFAPCLIG